MKLDKIGKELRDYRLSLKVGLRELSRRAGISPASLSSIEKGTTSPTLATMDKILKGLGTDLAGFFSRTDKQDQSPVIHAEQMKVLADNNRQYTILLPKRDDVKIEFFYEVIKYTESETEWETHNADLAGHIISGGPAVIEIKDAGKWQISEGDSYYINANRPHRLYTENEKSITQITVLI